MVKKTVLHGTEHMIALTIKKAVASAVQAVGGDRTLRPIGAGQGA